jgi:hypothetical protein
MDELHGTMEVALITAAFLLVVGYAMFEARQDFERIQEGEHIDHISEWFIRASVTLFIWGVASLKIGLDTIPCVIGSAFLFSAVFRYCLNRMRGKDWRYMAPWSNYYDRFFYALACLYWWTDAHLRSHKILLKDYHKSTIVSGSDIHRAGNIAYITEAVILAVCVLWVVLK